VNFLEATALGRFNLRKAFSRYQKANENITAMKTTQFAGETILRDYQLPDTNIPSNVRGIVGTNWQFIWLKRPLRFRTN